MQETTCHDIDSFKIDRISAIEKNELGFLAQKLNEETPNLPPVDYFEFYVRTKDNEIIAGCDGLVEFGLLFIDQLWVHPAYRNRTLGSQFISKIHDYGRSIGCRYAAIETYNFGKSKKFFDRLGYKLDFVQRAYLYDVSCTFMTRSL